LFLLLVYSLIRLRGKELRVLAMLCVVLLVIISLFLAIGSALNLQQPKLYFIKINALSVMVADRLFGIQLPVYDPGIANQDLLGEGGSPAERVKLYARSLETFLEHPLFGVGSRANTDDYSQVGLHSTWLDYLAMYGLPSFGLFLGFMAMMFRRLRRMQATRSEKAYRMVAFTIYMLYGLVNPVIATAVFPVVLLFYITGCVKLPGEEPAHV
ncbi:MAG TPA: O-antigen ligase family protein, partial [Clostridia bacterium]